MVWITVCIHSRSCARTSVWYPSVLFEGTIAENISIGKPGASPPEVMEAARKANIHDVIINGLGGYQRLVREQGKDLSGGQRQRIAIARAICAMPRS